MRQVYLLSSDQLDHYWPEIAQLLTEVPGFYDYYTPEWAYSAAKKGDLQVWALSDEEIRAIVLTQILCFPRQKTFEVLAAGGAGLLDFVNEMEETFNLIAHSAGCATITGKVRPGLAKMFGDRATQRYVALTRPVREPERRQ